MTNTTTPQKSTGKSKSPDVSIEAARNEGVLRATEWLSRDDAGWADRTDEVRPCESSLVWRAQSLAYLAYEVRCQEDILQVIHAWEVGFDSTLSAATPTGMKTIMPTPSAIQSNYRALAVESAADAVNMSALGECCIAELRELLRALVKLTVSDDIAHGLAKIGYRMAGDHHNQLDAEHEDMEQKFLVLEGKNHA